MTLFRTDSYVPSDYDVSLEALLASMSMHSPVRCIKPWRLHYIPPKHLRLPYYTYKNAEESSVTDLHLTKKS